MIVLGLILAAAVVAGLTALLNAGADLIGYRPDPQDGDLDDDDRR